MPDDERYTLTELADLAGVTPRTVRYYLGQGLLPAVGQSGPGAKYGTGHLARLRLIRRLQGEHLPLAEIRRRLERLDDATVIELAGSEAPAPPTDSALDYLRGILGDAGGRTAPGPTRGPGRASVSVPEPPPAATAEPAATLQPARALQPAPDTPAGRAFLRETVPGPAAPSMAPGGAPIPAPESLEARDAPEAPATPDAPFVLAERLGDSPGPTAAAVPAAPVPTTSERSQWERIALAPDVELHIRRPLTRSLNKAVDRLVTIARELLEEDPS